MNDKQTILAALKAHADQCEKTNPVDRHTPHTIRSIASKVDDPMFAGFDDRGDCVIVDRRINPFG